MAKSPKASYRTSMEPGLKTHSRARAARRGLGGVAALVLAASFPSPTATVTTPGGGDPTPATGGGAAGLAATRLLVGAVLTQRLRSHRSRTNP